MTHMIKKINLGSGPVGKDDWINVDWGMLSFLHKFSLIEGLLLKLNLFPKGHNVKWPKNLILHDCRKKLPFADSTFDYVYTSHFLEHFKKFEAERIIKDCYNLLCKGGVMRIAVPDLEVLAQKYLAKDTEYFRRADKLMSGCGGEPGKPQDFLLADTFMDIFYPSFYKKEPAGIQRFFVSFVRPHCWMYDYESLRHLLKNGGFVNIQRKSFGEGRVPDLASLDVFPELSLYVEAEK